MRFAVPVVAVALLLSAGAASSSEITFGAVTVGTPTATPTHAVPGEAVTFAVTASSTDLSAILEYSWNFGDSVTSTPFSPTAASITHTYAGIDQYVVTVAVREVGTSPGVLPTGSVNITIHRPIPAQLPTASSTIILDSTNGKVWCVNADQDTVSSMTLAGGSVTSFPVGKSPRTLAQAADKTIWVVSQQHPSVSVLNPLTGALEHVVPLPHGSLPYGICMTPDGTAAYVSFQASGIVKISTSTRQVLASNPEPPTARGIAVTSDGRVLVTRFNSPQSNPLLSFQDPEFTSQNRGEVIEFTSSLAKVRTFVLPLDPGVTGTDPDFGNGPVGPLASANGSRGVPNYLTSLVVNPDGRNAFVPSKKDNIQRGVKTPERDGLTPGSEITYRAIVSTLDLVGNTVPPTGRFDLDNAEMPQAACFSPFGDYLFIALQGNNRILVKNLYKGFIAVNGINGDFTGSNPTATDGLSPQGLVIDPATGKLYVHNYMGRTVTIMDVSGILNQTASAIPTPGTVITTVAPGDDLLGDGSTFTVLNGKRIFYNAGDPRMSLNGYVSCAGCHLDGGADMRVWDFTNRTEGFRNTVMLQGRGTGTAVKHGNAHWTGNFDEIQDFENDIQNAFGGTGFSGGPPNPPMGASNANRPAPNSNLDALALYVNSLTKVSRSPFRNADGTLTASGEAGEEVFKARNCQACHGGREFADAQVFTLPVPAVGPSVHNVGTLRATSGSRLGQTLTGIDSPTLKGLWQTAPYFHDGSALTLMDVMNAVSLTTPNAHGMDGLTEQQKIDLAQYMLEIDEVDAPPVDPSQVDTVTLDSVATGRPYSLANATTGALVYVDRSYTLQTNIAALTNLNNQILLRTSEDDKGNTSATLVTLTATTATEVYVFYDSRATTLPAWLASFNEAFAPAVSHDVRISPGNAATGLLMTAHKRTFPAGTIVLGGNREGGAAGALRNWFAILKPVTKIYSEGPLSQLEWVHDKDADGDGLKDDYEAVSLLSPWVANFDTPLLPDEDKIISGTTTAFDEQTAQEATAPVGDDGGSSGGCGLSGLECLLPLLLAGLARRRRR